MSTDALLLVLIAACAHAAWNIIAHGSSRSGLPFLFWGAIVSTVLWLPVVPLTGGLGAGGWRGLLLGASVSAVLHVLYMVLLQRGYAAGELSTVYATARGTGPTLTVLFAVLVMGERPSKLALLGVAVVIAGVIAMGLIARQPKATRFSPAALPAARRRVDPALLFGLATGVAIAAYTLWDTHALREWQVSPVALMVGCSAMEVPLLAVLAWRSRAEILPTVREQWRRLLAFGALSPLSYILVLVAVTIAPVSLVAPMREVSVVLVSLFAAIVGREQRPVQRVIASAAVVGGAFLLSL